jgi:cell wall-associated NlpC family hydrolase
MTTTIYGKPIPKHHKRTDSLAVHLKKEIKKTKSKTGVVKTAKSYLGTRYRFGGTSRRGIDCSGFTKCVMKKHGKNLPRTASQQASTGKHINKKNLKVGDLVFFKNTYKRGISHVGIYIGHNKFIHASSGAHKVTISSLNKKFYRQHYAGARRV